MNRIFLLFFFSSFLSLMNAQSNNEQEFEQFVQDLEENFNVSIYFPDNIEVPVPFKSKVDTSEELNLILDGLFANSIFDYLFYDEHNVVIGPRNIINRKSQSIDFLSRSKVEKKEAIAIQKIQIGSSEESEVKSQYLIKGYVADDNFKDALIGVTIEIEGENIATISDEIGVFEFEIEPGEYTLKANYLGYLEKQIILQILGDGKLDILLSKEAYQLEEVTISAEGNVSNVNRTESGIESLSAKEIQRIPALMGEADVIKTLLLLPGVSTVGEGSSGINIRGGSVDQNLILMDGIPIFNASHVLGLFSLFNPDMVKGLELYKGSTPAQFGGRASSIMDVELKDGNFNKYQGRGGLGLVSSRLTLEGPVINEKISFIAGTRFSFSDWIFSNIRVAEIQNSKANFYDGNVKLTARLGNRGKLFISGYTSYDRFKFDDNFDFNWQTNAANLGLNYLIRPNVSFALQASVSDYGSQLEDPKPNIGFSYENGIRNFRIKPYLRLEEIFGINSILGIESNYFSINRGSLAPFTEQSSVLPVELDLKNGFENSYFINLNRSLGNRLDLSAGIRYSTFYNLGPDRIGIYGTGAEITSENRQDILEFGPSEIIQFYSGWEPRISLKLQLKANQSLKFSYNKTRQYISQLFNATAVTPVDLWQMSNRFIEPIVADNFSIGYFIDLQEKDWENSVEIFYRDIDNIIEYKDLADLFLNEFIETELIPAQGRAYGMELSVKKNVGRLTGRIAYTFSRTISRTNGTFPKEQINNNNWFFSNYDRPHDLSIVSTYQFTKRTYASLNFVYSSGRPTSAPTGNVTISNAVSVPIYGERNIYRIPDYHRLDFSYTIEQSHKKTQKWRSSWTFSIYNLYGRQNAFSVFFTQKPGQGPRANRLAVLARPIPSLTYNFNF